MSELGNQNELLRAIGEKLLELGIEVHGWKFDRDQQRRNLKLLADVKAYAIGYDNGKSDAVKQQYWLYVSMQKQRNQVGNVRVTRCTCQNSGLMG